MSRLNLQLNSRLLGVIAFSSVLLTVHGLKAADAKADASKGGKDAKAASTNTTPWRVTFTKSEFLGLPEIKDRTKFKKYTDPFFPKTERIFPKPKIVKPPQPPTTTQTNQATSTNAVAQIPVVVKPPEPPKPKWFAEFAVSGVLGARTSRIAIVQVGGDAYYFRVGAIKDVITAKGPAKVTCVKITDDSVELTMAGEKESATLELP